MYTLVWLVTLQNTDAESKWRFNGESCLCATWADGITLDTVFTEKCYRTQVTQADYHKYRHFGEVYAVVMIVSAGMKRMSILTHMNQRSSLKEFLPLLP